MKGLWIIADRVAANKSGEQGLMRFTFANCILDVWQIKVAQMSIIITEVVISARRRSYLHRSTLELEKKCWMLMHIEQCYNEADEMG